MPSAIEIVDLRQRPPLFDIVVGWHGVQWGHIRPRAQIEQWYRESLAGAPDLFTLVALIDEAPAGMASLRPSDAYYASHGHLRPWLDSVYVAPDFRQRGVARALCAAIIDRAARNGIAMLHLGTDSAAAERLYAELGFVAIADIAGTDGVPARLMRRELISGTRTIAESVREVTAAATALAQRDRS